MLALLAQTKDATLYMPAQDSTFAADYDWTWYFIYYISVFFTVGISLTAVYFAVKYRRRPDRIEGEHTQTHHTALEMTWTTIPLVLVLMIFWFGFQGFMDKATPPRDTYDITVNSNRWNWTFIYPNGAVTDTLYVPADEPVKLTLTSEDVIHSLFIPAFRVKKDAVPGRYNQMWFQAIYSENRAERVLTNLEGRFTGQIHDLYCAEYCGRRHSVMTTNVVVLPADQFHNAIAQLAEPAGTPAEVGERLTQIYGCAQCHAFDESATVATGPPLYDLFGRPGGRPLNDGSTVEVDEEYIHESIVAPGAKIAQGYRNEMASFAGLLDDNDIAAIIEYLKSISEHHDSGSTEQSPGQEPEETSGEAADQPTTGETGEDVEETETETETEMDAEGATETMETGNG